MTRRYGWTIFALGATLGLLVASCSDTPATTSVIYPHAIVNRSVSQAALRAMAHNAPNGGPILAGADVLRDTNPPRAVLYFAAEVGLTERQAHIVGHELSHVVAKLLGVRDRTHEADGGVIR